MIRHRGAGLSVGMDGCPGGWVAVALAPDGAARIRVCGSVSELWDAWADEVVRAVVDIPVELPETAASRACDQAARAILKRHLPSARDLPRSALVEHPRRIVGSDDVVDALAAAVVGLRFGDRLETVPPEPPRGATGLAMEMVVPPGIA